MSGVEEILRQLCRTVEKQAGANVQSVYILEPMDGARLAFEIFHSYGFDVKLYDDHGRAKFYYTPPDENPDKTARKLDILLAHSRGLERLRTAAETLKSDTQARVSSFKMHYSNPNIGGHDRRLVIDLIAPAAPASAAAAKPQPDMAAPVNTAPPAKSATNYNTKKKPTEDLEGEFSAGPQVAKKTLYKIYKEQMESGEHDSLWAQLMNYLKSQRATTAFWVVLYLAGMLVVYSFWVLAQAYLCPDLATVKVHYWYCNYK